MHRRLHLIPLVAMVAMALIAAACTGAGNNQTAPAAGHASGSSSGPPAGPARGGDLVYVTDEAPPTLDVHRSNVTTLTIIGLHLYEGLYTLNANGQPIPMLAAAHDVSPDGKVYTIRLREGVKFHNGKEMTSADVVASLQRWGKVAGPGISFFKNVASLTAPDAHTVRLELKERSGVVLTTLGTPHQAAAIYPKEVVEAADPKEGIKSFVGTGPFRFAEHLPDQYLKLTRFDGYQPVDQPPSGLGGKKVAYVDNLYFRLVPEASIRAAGVETGEYQFANGLGSDQYRELLNNPKLDVIVSPPRGWNANVFNLKKGPMTNLKLRQAWQAALDVENAELSTGGKELKQFAPSIMLKDTGYYSAAGKELYNQKNPTRARQLLAEAGYDGTRIRWMTNSTALALAAKQQLEAVGFKIDLQVVEWATLVQRRGNPDLWDVFSTGYNMRPEPTDMAFLACSNPPFWCDEGVADLIQRMRLEGDFEKRFALWEQIQTAFYQQVPIVKYADYSSLRAKSKSLQGYVNQDLPVFWNVWLAKG